MIDVKPKTQSFAKFGKSDEKKNNFKRGIEQLWNLVDNKPNKVDGK